MSKCSHYLIMEDRGYCQEYSRMCGCGGDENKCDHCKDRIDKLAAEAKHWKERAQNAETIISRLMAVKCTLDAIL